MSSLLPLSLHLWHTVDVLTHPAHHRKLPDHQARLAYPGVIFRFPTQSPLYNPGSRYSRKGRGCPVFSYRYPSGYHPSADWSCTPRSPPPDLRHRLSDCRPLDWNVYILHWLLPVISSLCFPPDQNLSSGHIPDKINPHISRYYKLVSPFLQHFHWLFVRNTLKYWAVQPGC